MPENKLQTKLKKASIPPEDESFANDIQNAILLQSPRGGRLLLYAVALLVTVAVTWAWFATIDEVIKGMGKVVPASHVKKIQNLEGGILEKLHVREGQMVNKGDLLLELRDLQFASTAEKNRIEINSLQAQLVRLHAEAYEAPLEFPAELEDNVPAMIEEQHELYAKRKVELSRHVEQLKSRHEQKQDELKKMQKQLQNSTETYQMSRKEYNLLAPLVKKGAASPVELLHAKQTMHEAKAKMEAAQFAVPQLEKEIKEAAQAIEQANSEFQSKALAERNGLLTKLKEAKAEAESLQDKVNRAAVRSPVKGVVKKINIDTIGGTIQPGMVMMEIVPLDDNLLIETKIRPKDIGFIRIGQKAKVKLTAYDFSIYGGLDGIVDRVSADSITDQKGRTYFRVMVKINQTYLGSKEDPLPIIPGMQAEVDIVLAQRNVLMYIFKPLLKSKYH
jgi:adhesin transport system membrane fusion protein